MNTNYSAPKRAGNQFIDWKTSTDPPRSLASGECDRYFIGWPHFLWSQLQPRLQVKPKRNPSMRRIRAKCFYAHRG